MPLDPGACYRALRARDRRFDGTFFVAVKTTGIYCRPICPARTPGADRCSFFTRAAEAERAGFRACFRCRPELAPGLAPMDSTPRLVRTAAAEIDSGSLDEDGVEALASRLGVTSRHLRRAMEAELGVSPVEYAQTRRLALAKQLLHDTSLPLAEVAFASGFGSVRRFNALFRATFGRAPSDLRRTNRRSSVGDETITMRLEYRPPLGWNSLLAFLRGRAIPGVESVDEHEYRRSVRLGDHIGWLSVRHAEGSAPALLASLSMTLAPKLTNVVARLRVLFDLDAQPHLVAQHLRKDDLLRPLLAKEPGLRLPGAFDPFEMAIRAVLGQQVSVKGATTLAGRLVQAFGRSAALGRDDLHAIFPTALELSGAPLEKIRAIGLPSARARTILELSRAVADNRIDLSGGRSPEAMIALLQELPGIGPWTAHYLAMRAMRWPDAFVAGDLGVRKALGLTSSRAAEERVGSWRPWRAYGVMHLWSSYSSGG